MDSAGSRGSHRSAARVGVALPGSAITASTADATRAATGASDATSPATAAADDHTAGATREPSDPSVAATVTCVRLSIAGHVSVAGPVSVTNAPDDNSVSSRPLIAGSVSDEAAGAGVPHRPERRKAR